MTDQPDCYTTNPRQELPEPFPMSWDDAQSLMDQLWNCGVRPTEGTGSAGSLAATKNHLEDMRRIVFKEYPK